MSDTVRVLFPFLGRGGWSGGYNYLRNTLRLIRSRLDGEITALVFLTPAEAAAHGDELAALARGGVHTEPAFVGAGRGQRLARSLVRGADPAIARLVRRERVDVLVEHASFFGRQSGVPVLAWIPDFQHRHMPHMFERPQWWRRELGFRMQIAAGRRIMVSSESARADLERFYPAARGRAAVVRFAVDIEPAAFIGRGAELRAAYGLPERFFFLPNQFWRHKNHRVIVDALARLKAAGGLDAMPPVVLTGQPKDIRYPGHFEALMADVTAVGIGSHFRYLGLVPFEHVLALNASAIAMINPSLFEGWSTPIEEAKAFGTPLVLSDLPIHREQAPDATFFGAEDADAAARALVVAATRPTAGRPSPDALRAEQEARLAAHADGLRAAIAGCGAPGR